MKSDATALLEVDDLAKSYRGIRAVAGVSFRIPPNTIVGIIGPNGSGKSTAIDCITCCQPADRGRSQSK